MAISGFMALNGHGLCGTRHHLSNWITLISTVTKWLLEYCNNGDYNVMPWSMVNKSVQIGIATRNAMIGTCIALSSMLYKCT